MPNKNIRRGPSAGGAPADFTSRATANDIYVDGLTGILTIGTGTSGTSSKVVLAVGDALAPVVNSTAVIAPTLAANGGRLTVLTSLAAGTVTLPAATGTGNKYRFIIGVAPTSASWVFQVASGSDYMRGQLNDVTDDVDGVGVTFPTSNTNTLATESDTITWNRSTTGVAAIGDWVEFWDVVTAVWNVSGNMSSTGAEATPFSAAV